jgi:hypothetical protein
VGTTQRHCRVLPFHVRATCVSQIESRLLDTLADTRVEGKTGRNIISLIHCGTRSDDHRTRRFSDTPTRKSERVAPERLQYKLFHATVGRKPNVNDETATVSFYRADGNSRKRGQSRLKPQNQQNLPPRVLRYRCAWNPRRRYPCQQTYSKTTDGSRSGARILPLHV